MICLFTRFRISLLLLLDNLNNVSIVALSSCILNLVWIHCVATTLTDSNCTSSWVSHTAGNLSANLQRRHHGASSLKECQRACEFDPSCVAFDLWTFQRPYQCWINTNASHQHRTANNWSHYDLVSRCNITTGQFPTFSLFDNIFLSVIVSKQANLYISHQNGPL